MRGWCDAALGSGTGLGPATCDPSWRLHLSCDMSKVETQLVQQGGCLKQLEGDAASQALGHALPRTFAPAESGTSLEWVPSVLVMLPAVDSVVLEERRGRCWFSEAPDPTPLPRLLVPRGFSESGCSARSGLDLPGAPPENLPHRASSPLSSSVTMSFSNVAPPPVD
ncbi:Receptor-Type Tyrosine-Protein Phosphatase Delta [Manis pentadactyla]|nr:Receptor-Type Tyrosine-Protein Phosphatase Delta [Manis pentadactyla]